MSTIMNTVDRIGDVALVNSIIDKSITEFTDNICTSIGEYAFFQCTNLTRVDISSATIIRNNSFSGCSKLETLILRNANIVSLASANALSNTLIENGTGYIYVPSNLVDDYKTDSEWSAYDNQIKAIEE